MEDEQGRWDGHVSESWPGDSRFTTELNHHGETGRVLKTFHLSRGSFRSEELPVSEEHPRRDFHIGTVSDLAFRHNFVIKVQAKIRAGTSGSSTTEW